MPSGKPMIAAMPIDSLENLENADLPPGAAKAIVKVITDHTTAAISGLATKEDLEAHRVATKYDFDTFTASMRHDFDTSTTSMRHDFDTFTGSMRHDFETFTSSMRHEFDTFSASIRHDFNVFRAEMKNDFVTFGAEIRIAIERSTTDLHKQITDLQSRVTNWFLTGFGTMLLLFTGFIYFIVTYVKK
jgi:hypothetical protein